MSEFSPAQSSIMHISTLLLPALAGQALAGCIYARSGESAPRNAQDFHDEVARALPAQHGGDDPPVVRELIGDLKNGITTPVGQQIANIILANSSVKTVTGQSAVKGTAPTTPAACAADKCCVWYNVAKDLTTLYGGCSDTARAAIRLGFHDAGEWDRTSTFGGADGSMILFKEYTRAENQGLQQISQQLNTTYNKYHTSNGISMADLVQFAAVHAIRTCPQAPRLRAYVGRKDGTVTNTNGLLPAVTASAASLVSLFQAKTIVAEDLVALVGAHTTSKQFFVDTTKAGQVSIYFPLFPTTSTSFFHDGMLTHLRPAPRHRPRRLGRYVLQPDSSADSTGWRLPLPERSGAEHLFCDCGGLVGDDASGRLERAFQQELLEAESFGR